jgi:predicted phage terminase large subunit-like protein
VSSLSEEQRTAYARTVRVNLPHYVPHKPLPKQIVALLLGDHVDELFYGGSAGPGKSELVLMGASKYLHVPKYAALILRRSYKDLSLPGALMSRAQDWFANSDAKWSDDAKTWYFPTTGGSPSSITFGFLDSEVDKYNYKSADFQYIGFDELTQFSQSQYRYLFSRLRKPVGFPVPLRAFSASNPGDKGHEWVKAHFNLQDSSRSHIHKVRERIGGRTFTLRRLFLPGRLEDNPYLDRDTYLKSLSHLDPVTRLQMLNGDWTARHGGSIFRREWFRILDAYPAGMRLVRFWDLAATEALAEDPEHAWTCGVKMGMKDGQFYIVNVVRIQGRPSQNEQLISQVAAIDGRAVDVAFEEEYGSAGKNLIDHYRRNVLPGYAVRGIPPKGSKETRASPLSSAAEAGNVYLVRGEWNEKYLDEIEAFPLGTFVDQVDASSGAHSVLTTLKLSPQAVGYVRGGMRR